MSAEPGNDTATMNDGADAVDEARERLGDTAEDLANRAGVKAKIAETKAGIGAQAEHLKAKAGEAMPDGAQEAADRARAAVRERPKPIAAGAIGFMLAMLLLVLLVRSRRA
jgi:hypothetical protein